MQKPAAIAWTRLECPVRSLRTRRRGSVAENFRVDFGQTGHAGRLPHAILVLSSDSRLSPPAMRAPAAYPSQP